MASRRRSRRIAVQALYSWDVGGIDEERILAFDWVDDRDALDTTFTRLLVHGTLSHVEEIDAMIEAQLEHWDLSRLHRVDFAILRVAAFSLIYQREISAHVTIDEAVELAKELSTDDAYRFINGVLDGIRKRLETDGNRVE
ncbi:MAG: transcription antitermination factor NusB [Alkalispirochaeta sp.]